MRRPELVLVDANAIIEAVRTGCWPAITGGLTVETVATCRDETRPGATAVHREYVPVNENDISRLNAVHSVEELAVAGLKLAYAGADGMDAGERDLVAWARQHATGNWVLCSPDKATVRAAVALGLGDHLCSLEELAAAVGAPTAPPLKRQHTTEWLRSFRTSVVLEEGIE